VTHHATRYLKFLLKLLVSGGLCVFLFFKLDTPAIRQGMLSLDGRMFFGGLFAMALLLVLQGWRWLIIARALDLKVGFHSACALSFIGAFFSQVLPSSVGGDLVRVYRLYRAGQPLGLSLHSTIIDRVLAAVGLLVLAYIGFGMVGWSAMPERLVIALGIFTAAIIAGVVLLLTLDFIPLPKWLAKLRVVQKVRHICADARRISRHLPAMCATMAASLVAHIGVSAVFFLLGSQVGLGADLAMCIALVPLVTLATMIPISVAGWGVREGAMVLVFGSVGANSSAALVTSILLGLATACSSLPGALVWLRDSRHAHLYPHPQ
jgi:uncharacterized protein (TIRG00374 family)